MAYLLLGSSRIDRNRDRADAEHREIHHGPLVAGPSQHGYPVAMRGAVRQQHLGDGPDVVGELPVADVLPAGGVLPAQHGAVRGQADALVQNEGQAPIRGKNDAVPGLVLQHINHLLAATISNVGKRELDGVVESRVKRTRSKSLANSAPTTGRVAREAVRTIRRKDDPARRTATTKTSPVRNTPVGWPVG